MDDRQLIEHTGQGGGERSVGVDDRARLVTLVDAEMQLELGGRHQLAGHLPPIKVDHDDLLGAERLQRRSRRGDRDQVAIALGDVPRRPGDQSIRRQASRRLGDTLAFALKSGIGHPENANVKESSLSTFNRIPMPRNRARQPAQLRNTPTQARSRERLRRVLDAADEVLADDGAGAFTTTRIAAVAQVPIGSIYRFFDDKQAIIEALALRYWSDFADLVAAAAEADELDPLHDPAAVVLDALAAGFRARPGFLALWYGGLRTERVRDTTRSARQAIGRSIERILANHWPQAPAQSRARAAEMVVLAGDGLLREAFRRDRGGDAAVLVESKLMLSSYVASRLGEPAR